MSDFEKDLLERFRGAQDEIVEGRVSLLTIETAHKEFPILKEIDEYYESLKAGESFKREVDKIRRSIFQYHKLLHDSAIY